jgi:microcystin-dependent protein
MAQPYVGEVRMFAGNFAPAGWMFCSGQLLPISEYETLFNLIGTTYGGDGQSTFALPDLQSRVPIHQGTGGGSSYVLAQNGGVESLTLTTSQIPAHNHALIASLNAAGGSSPNNSVLGESDSIRIYRPAAPNQSLGASTVQSDGGSQPHDNMQPYLCVSFIISLFGIYPSPT